MAVIGCSLVSFFAGGNPDTTGVVSAGLSSGAGFWPVFAVLFPAVTGIEAGIGMSGDLRDSARSLPRGTIAAVILGYFAYIAVITFLWLAVADRAMFTDYPMIMRYVARWGRPVLLGIWAASLSSAMGSLLGAPRTLQALAKDRVVPVFLGRGYGKGKDPRIATTTAFIVALSGILLGDLNRIAQVLSMFFLTSYGLLNVSAGLEELTHVPSWRPTFRVPWVVSLLGAFGCFFAMFMISPGATFGAAFVAVAVYLLMQRRSLKARWGDMRSAILMLIAKYTIQALSRHKPDERTWKPNILVLSGSPISRWRLVELASAISLDRGFLTMAAIVPEETPGERIESMTLSIRNYLEKREVQAVVEVYPAETPMDGAKTLIKTYGYGPIRPNTVLLGMTEKPENYSEFSELVVSAAANGQNLVVVREGENVEETRGTQNGRIDLWWYGTEQNLGFMLSMAYLLKRSPEWRSAELVLNSIVMESGEVQETREKLTGFIDNVRLEARANVLVRQSENIFEDIRDNSVGARIVFLGMRAPDKRETTEEYSRYYEDLLARTENLPPAAFVLASGKTDFYGIFESRTD